MAVWTRAQADIEGRAAFYETEVKLNSGEIVGPCFVIELAGGFAECEEIAETLTRSWAQKARTRKPTEPTQEKDSNPIVVKADPSEPARLNAKAT